MPRSTLSRISRPRTTPTQTAESTAPEAGERDGIVYGETITLGPEAAEAAEAKPKRTRTAEAG